MMLRDVAVDLLNALETHRPVVFCRLVETRGSTPQKAGAAMLVYADGSQSGTLGGGCVEAEVKKKALQLLVEGKAEIVRFQLDSNYGWDDGLICGGRMQVLIEPLRDRSKDEYYRHWSQAIVSGRGGQECVVFDEGESKLPPTAVLLFDEHEQFVTSLRVSSVSESLDVITPRLRKLDDRPGVYAMHGMAFLPVLPRCRLVIVGGGHVGQAVADLASDLDFDVCVIDDREEFVRPERIPKAKERLHGPIDQILPNLAIDADTYCLIVTRGHNHDERALYHLADRGARYVGMIGSRRKIKLIFDDLLAEGIPEEALARVYAPVGIDIGSQTVPEIAVSICAELISHRNRHGVVPGRPSPVFERQNAR